MNHPGISRNRPQGSVIDAGGESPVSEEKTNHEDEPLTDEVQQTEECDEKEIIELTEQLKEDAGTPAPPGRPESEPEKAWNSWPLAIALVLIAAGLTAANFLGFGLYQPAPSPPTVQERQQELRAEVRYYIDYVNAVAQETGRLPADSEELGLEPGNAIVYVLVDDTRYRLTATDGESRVEYDSTQDPDQFYRVPEAAQP